MLAVHVPPSRGMPQAAVRFIKTARLASIYLHALVAPFTRASPGWAWQVNKYPIQRSFTAIGSGGDEFRQSIVGYVERVVGSVHVECVAQRASSGGKYLSVTVGPVWLENGDQVGSRSWPCRHSSTPRVPACLRGRPRRTVFRMHACTTTLSLYCPPTVRALQIIQIYANLKADARVKWII